MAEGSSVRRLPRYQIVLPVSYQATPKGAPAPKEGSGWTRNLSETGACVELTESLPAGTVLSLMLRDEEGGLSLVARVVWVGYPPVPAGGTIHGVAFGELSLHQRLVLSALLHRHAGLRVQATRLPAALPALCRPLGPAGDPLQGWTGDLGREGCLLLLPESLPVGTLIAVTLATPRGDVSAKATVVWVEPAGQGGMRQLIRHGVRFVEAREIQEAFRAMTLEGSPAQVGSTPPAE
jgi:hypothetical protein